jgi:hypothetical protein
VFTGLLAAGCGHGAGPSSSPARTRTEFAEARVEVTHYAETLTAAVRRTRLSRSPVALGSYRPCPRAGKNLVAYYETITVKSDMATTMPEMSREIARLLRSEGWRLVSVDFAKVHIALADTNHPLYNMSQHDMKGAANILPYGSDKSGAIIFMHSSCFDAGPLGHAST